MSPACVELHASARDTLDHPLLPAQMMGHLAIMHAHMTDVTSMSRVYLDLRTPPVGAPGLDLHSPPVGAPGRRSLHESSS